MFTEPVTKTPAFPPPVSRRRTVAAWWMMTALIFAVAVPAARPADTAAPGATFGPGWRMGFGVEAAEADSAKAGDAAARQARAQFGEGAPKVVFVLTAIDQLTPALVDAVAAVFPREIIYGAETAAPLTMETNFPDGIDTARGVGVWALGGNVDVAFAVEPVGGGDENAPAPADADPSIEAVNMSHYVSGRALGERLAAAARAMDRPGRIVVTQGDQLNGPNQAFAKGLAERLDGLAAVIGGASGKSRDNHIVAAGTIYTKANYGVLIGGDFRLGMALYKGPHTPATTRKSLDTALAQGDGAKPFFALMFNCRRRRQMMMLRATLPEELATIRQAMGDAPFFGSYGGGEIGAEKAGEASVGTGFSIVTAAFFPLAE